MSKVEANNVDEVVNLTPQQMGMLFIYLKDKYSAINLEQVVLKIEGDIDQGQIECTFDAVVKKHATLRSIFRWSGIKTPLQIVLKERRPFDAYIDLTAIHGESLCEKLELIIKRDGKHQFDLEQGAVRMTLIRTSTRQMVLLFTIHHIICDGWSTSVIVQEFLSLYNRTIDVSEYLTSPDDYYLIFSKYIKNLNEQAHQAFWEERFRHSESASIHMSYVRKNSDEYQEYAACIHENLAKQVDGFVKRNRITMASLMFYTWGKAFSALTSLEESAFDVTVSTRTDFGHGEDINGSVGLFINTIPVKYLIHENIEHFQNRFVESLNYSFLPIEGQQSASALRILLVVENYPFEWLLRQNRGKVLLTSLEAHQISGYDITILIIPHGMRLLISYNHNMIAQSLVTIMVESFEASLSSTFLQETEFKLPSKYKDMFSKLLADVPRNTSEEHGGSYGMLHTEIEKALAGIWAQILKVEVSEIDADSNFFQLGGHSLSALSMINTIEKRLHLCVGVDKIFEYPQLSQFAQHLNQSCGMKLTHLEKAEKKVKYPVSFEQKRMYVMYLLDRQSTCYNVSAAYVLKGTVDRRKIGAALAILLERHEVLRSMYEEEDGQIYQIVSSADDYTFAFEEGPGRDDIDEVIAKFIRPFQLGCEIPFRAKILQVTEDEFVLIIDMHHIACDGVSTGILLHEFIALLNQQQLPAAEYQYTDYSQWQHSEGYNRFIEGKREFWVNEFRDTVCFAPVGYDSREEISEHEGRQVFFTLDNNIVSRLNEIALTHRTSLFCVLLSAYFILLCKIGRNKDMTVGIPVANRTHSDFADIVGLFINTLPLRLQWRKGDDYTGFLTRLAEKWAVAFLHQEYQLDKLYDDLSHIHGNVQNLFTAGFLLQNMDIPQLRLPDITVTEYRIKNNTAKFNLLFIATEKEKNLEFEVVYRRKYFDKRSLDYIIVSYQEIIQRIIADCNICVQELVQGSPALSAGELMSALD